MRSKSQRVVAGIVAGLIIGVLGPTLSAVAGKSGNREPEPAAATSSSSVRRGGYFDVVQDAGTKIRRYHFHVWTELASENEVDSTTASAWRDWRGEAVALLETCVKNTNKCARKTMRGPIGGVAPTGAAAGTNWFAQEPGLRLTAFGGTLKAGPTSCTFDVKWMDPSQSPTPNLMPRYAFTPDAAGPDATAGDVLTRWANVTAESGCWPHLQAGGWVWQASDATAATQKG